MFLPFHLFKLKSSTSSNLNQKPWDKNKIIFIAFHLIYYGRMMRLEALSGLCLADLYYIALNFYFFTYLPSHFLIVKLEETKIVTWGEMCLTYD
jgi:hypothetical protein